MDEQFKYKDSIIKVKSSLGGKEAVKDLIKSLWQELEDYISSDPYFQTSFEPLRLKGDAPRIARDMSSASKEAGLGPMSAVAGAFSERIVDHLIDNGANWALAENGGDICCYGERDFKLGLYAGKSPLSGKMGFLINPGEDKYGICTSSSTVGHSISLGKADGVTVFSKDALLADSFATAIANEVDGIEDAIPLAESSLEKGIDGVVIIKDKLIGKVGKIPRTMVF